MSNRYLVKIAETLTAQEQAALANGRDRYTSQAVLGGFAGRIAGDVVQAATLPYAMTATAEGKVGKALALGRHHLGAIGATAGVVAGGVKAFRHNSIINEAGKKDPRAYDTAIIHGGNKGYVGSTLGTVLGAATAVPATGIGPVSAIGNIGETIYHNRLVEAAKKRQIAGYDN